MNEAEECMAKYRQIFRLLEDEQEAISVALHGDVLNAYRELLDRERDVLESATKSLQHYINY